MKLSLKVGPTIMSKMANRKTRGVVKYKSEIVTKKVEDASEIVRYPPVFSQDSKYFCVISGSNIRVYSVESAEKIYSFESHAADVIGLSVKDGRMVSCDNSGAVFEWDVDSGKVLETFKIGLPPLCQVLAFHNPENDKYFVRTVSSKQQLQADLWQVAKKMKERKLFSDIINSSQSVAFGCQSPDSSVLAALKDDCVIVKDIRSGSDKKHMTDVRKFTCVALHPSEQIMVTGDISGRVLLWYEFIKQNRPVKTVYHWHTLPVNAVCFSNEGTYMYSGGSEKTLIKWRLGTSNKQCLPRMGADIKFIVNAPDNVCVATSHFDNAIRLIDGTNQITRAVVGLVKHDPIPEVEGKESILPTGLVWDPRSRGLFFNAQAGHLQLFDLERNSIIFNLDIANRNILTNERNQVIGNSEVLLAAVSSDGQWLATFESWSNKSIGYLDVHLKFWHYNAAINNFELNTTVATPHNGDVTAIAFQPGVLGQEWPGLVSISHDYKFKIWRLVDDTDIYRKKDAWTCDIAGDFRQKKPSALSFSEDGSVLAVAFQDTVTLWNPTTASFNTTLSHLILDEPIKLMEFGKEECFRFLVCASETMLFAWDVITQEIQWTLEQLSSPVNCLTVDPKSIYMAAILKNSELFVFVPSSRKSVYHQTSVLGSEPISAVFTPRPNPLKIGPEWLINSRLMIVDSQQELYSLDDKSSPGINTKLVSQVSRMDSLPWTPFAAMKAQQQVLVAQKLRPVVHNTNKIRGYESIQSLLDTPASALPPMSRICFSFLKTYLTPHDKPSIISTDPAQTVEHQNLNRNLVPASDVGHITTSDISQDESLDLLLANDCDWLTENMEELAVCDMET